MSNSKHDRNNEVVGHVVNEVGFTLMQLMFDLNYNKRDINK